MKTQLRKIEHLKAALNTFEEVASDLLFTWDETKDSFEDGTDLEELMCICFPFPENFNDVVVDIKEWNKSAQAKLSKYQTNLEIESLSVMEIYRKYIEDENLDSIFQEHVNKKLAELEGPYTTKNYEIAARYAIAQMGFINVVENED